MLPFFARTLTRREMALGCAVLSLALLLSALPAALRWGQMQLDTGALLCADTLRFHIRADMAGIIPLKAAGMARYMNENVPGIAVPQDMIDKLAAAAAEGKEKGVKGLPMQLGIEMAAEMIAKIKDEHLCDGVHIMAIGAEKNVPAILEKAGVTI